MVSAKQMNVILYSNERDFFLNAKDSLVPHQPHQVLWSREIIALGLQKQR